MLTFAPPLRQSTVHKKGPRPRLDTSTERAITRQEFRDEANVNVVLAKFGVNALTHKQPIYTETDYSLDLQNAIATIDQVRVAWERLPQEVRDRYPDWRVVVQMLQEGAEPKELRDLLRPKEPKRDETQPTGTEPTPGHSPDGGSSKRGDGG